MLLPRFISESFVRRSDLSPVFVLLGNGDVVILIAPHLGTGRRVPGAVDLACTRVRPTLISARIDLLIDTFTSARPSV